MDQPRLLFVYFRFFKNNFSTEKTEDFGGFELGVDGKLLTT